MSVAEVLEFFQNLKPTLERWSGDMGPWFYVVLFAIIFAETGLVVTPFLPGDSLLFAAGAVAAAGGMNVWALLGLLMAAATLGNSVNYAIGRYVGPRVFHFEPGDRQQFWHRLLNRDHLQRAHDFFEKYGGKAVVLARFVPIVRTFVPFVAGVVSMTHATFMVYNLAGCVLWVGICVGGGYAFGNVPVVKEHFSLVAIGIVVVSVLPVAFELLQARRRRAAAGAAAANGGPQGPAE